MKMHKSRQLQLPMLCVSLLLAASFCLLAAGSIEAQPVINKELLSQDSLYVGRVLGWSLEGQAQTPLSDVVRFTTPSARPDTDPQIQTGGFRLIYVFITQYDKASVNEHRRNVRGVLIHNDPLRRCISTSFRVDYRIGSNGIISIDGSEIAPAVPPRPAVSVYYVPADKITSTVLNHRPISKLMKFAMYNSVPGAKWGSADGQEKKYYIFAFMMDRLPENIKMDLLVSQQASGISGQNMVTAAFQESGWHVAYAPYSFAVNGSSETLFKVIYTPDRGQPQLNALFTSDTLVKKTQRLLKAKGYDPGPIDGIMGQKTHNSIRVFQNDCGLKADGRLTPVLYGMLASHSGDRPLQPQIVNTSTGPNHFDRIKKKMWPNKVQK